MYNYYGTAVILFFFTGSNKLNLCLTSRTKKQKSNFSFFSVFQIADQQLFVKRHKVNNQIGTNNSNLKFQYLTDMKIAKYNYFMTF